MSMRGLVVVEQGSRVMGASVLWISAYRFC